MQNRNRQTTFEYMKMKWSWKLWKILYANTLLYLGGHVTFYENDWLVTFYENDRYLDPIIILAFLSGIKWLRNIIETTLLKNSSTNLAKWLQSSIWRFTSWNLSKILYSSISKSCMRMNDLMSGRIFISISNNYTSFCRGLTHTAMITRIF